jgi:hypothetical protein
MLSGINASTHRDFRGWSGRYDSIDPSSIGSLAQISFGNEDRSVTSLKGWQTVTSNVWPVQPPEGRIHLFVKLLVPRGERKIDVATKE